MYHLTPQTKLVIEKVFYVKFLPESFTVHPDISRKREVVINVPGEISVSSFCNLPTPDDHTNYLSAWFR